MEAELSLHCVFYSHLWCIDQVSEMGLGNLQELVLIELAQQSHIAPVFNQQKNDRFGISGLLIRPDALKNLAKSYPNVAAPLVLAPNPPISLAALESTVALLPTLKSPFKKAAVLIHINDAACFANAYTYMDQFSILWDIADFPNKVLEDASQVLVDNQCLTKARWGGIQLCEHPKRITNDIQQRRKTWQSLLSEYPALAVAS